MERDSSYANPTLMNCPDILAQRNFLAQMCWVWVGKKNPGKWSDEGKEAFFAECKLAAKIAKKAGVVLCLECHKNTYTETKESALELMQTVNSPAFRMNWRPNYECTVEENIAYIRMLKDYIIQVRVFQRKGLKRLPLEKGIDEWQLYLKELNNNQLLLLVHMPDHEVGTLRREASTLHRLIECEQSSFAKKSVLSSF